MGKGKYLLFLYYFACNGNRPQAACGLNCAAKLANSTQIHKTFHTIFFATANFHDSFIPTLSAAAASLTIFASACR
ncbi:MAG: hypothetical protein K2O27_03220, partial [Candidatus Amulumruptor sp.]|nr:hypothetical protein [Candidatus Amulumruptor sp.]